MATLTLSPTTRRDSAPAPTVNLTRRGQLVVTLLSLLLVVGFAFGMAGRVAAGGPDQAPALQKVVVQPGESLWGFAQKAMPGTDPREAVLRIRELNGLRGSVLQPGQPLLVPAS